MDVSGSSDVLWALAPQPDGKIIAAGESKLADDSDFARRGGPGRDTLYCRYFANARLGRFN